MGRQFKKKRSLWAGILLCCLLGSSVVSAMDRYPFEGALQEASRERFQMEGLSYPKEAKAMLPWINQLRLAAGLEKLVFDARLAEKAESRAIENQVLWAHVRPDGTRLYETDPLVAGENIHVGKTRAREVFETWRDSPAHYQNMMNPGFRRIGLAAMGTRAGEAPRWWVQVFSKEAMEEEPTEAEQEAIKEVRRVELSLPASQIVLGLYPKEAIDYPTGFDPKARYRMEEGSTAVCFPMLKLALGDAYPEPGSLALEDWDFEVLEGGPGLAIDAEGRMEAFKAGAYLVAARHKEKPETVIPWPVDVAKRSSLRYQARWAEELEEALAETVQARYRALPPLSAFQGRGSVEENQAKDLTHKVAEALFLDPGLAHYARALAKIYAGFLLPESAEVYPDLLAVQALLPPGERTAWQLFSDLDLPEDQVLHIPPWAKRFGLAVMDSGGHRLHVFVYAARLKPKLAPGLKEQGPFEAVLALYEETVDFALELEGVEGPVLRLRPEDLRQDEQGRWLWEPALRLAYGKSGPHPPLQPSFRRIALIKGQELLHRSPVLGQFWVKPGGEADVLMHLQDDKTGALLAVLAFRLDTRGIN